jgi:hypothetical protein
MLESHARAAAPIGGKPAFRACEHGPARVHAMDAGLRSQPDQAGKATPVAFPEHKDFRASGQALQQAKPGPFEIPSECGELKDPVDPGQSIEA